MRVALYGCWSLSTSIWTHWRLLPSLISGTIYNSAKDSSKDYYNFRLDTENWTVYCLSREFLKQFLNIRRRANRVQTISTFFLEKFNQERAQWVLMRKKGNVLRVREPKQKSRKGQSIHSVKVMLLRICPPSKSERNRQILTGLTATVHQNCRLLYQVVMEYWELIDHQIHLQWNSQQRMKTSD